MKYKFDPKKLAKETADAYSADCYANWTSVAQLLARLGYSEKEAECILRSKWTRWARDNWVGYPRRPTSLALRDFLMQDWRNNWPGGANVTQLVSEF